MLSASFGRATDPRLLLQLPLALLAVPVPQAPRATGTASDTQPAPLAFADWLRNWSGPREQRDEPLGCAPGTLQQRPQLVSATPRPEDGLQTGMAIPQPVQVDRPCAPPPGSAPEPLRIHVHREPGTRAVQVAIGWDAGPAQQPPPVDAGTVAQLRQALAQDGQALVRLVCNGQELYAQPAWAAARRRASLERRA